MTSTVIMKKAMWRSAIIVMLCVMTFVMMTVPSNAASQSGSVNGVSYTVSCDPSTFTYKKPGYTYVTTKALFSRSKPERNYVIYGLISKDVIATANSSGFMEASTGNYCCSTATVVYKEVNTVYGGTAGHLVDSFKKNGKSITKKYSLSATRNSNGLSQNKDSDVYLKFPKYIASGKKVYAAQSGNMTILWKKYSRTKNDHKRNSDITVSAKYGIGMLKLDPKVSTSGCNIAITKTTKCGGLVKTHAFKK